MKKDLLKGLTEEQITKVKACKNQEELLALAKQEGIELTETLPAQNVVLRKLKLNITKIQLLNGGITPVKIVALSGLLINSF